MALTLLPTGSGLGKWSSFRRVPFFLPFQRSVSPPVGGEWWRPWRPAGVTKFDSSFFIALWSFFFLFSRWRVLASDWVKKFSHRVGNTPMERGSRLTVEGYSQISLGDIFWKSNQVVCSCKLLVQRKLIDSAANNFVKKSFFNLQPMITKGLMDEKKSQFLITYFRTLKNRIIIW